MTRPVVLSCLLITLAAAASASPAGYPAAGVSQEIIPLSSPLYRDMDALYLLTGSGTPSNSRPWSKTEANLILARVDRASLSGTAAALRDSIAELAEPGLKFRFRDGFDFGIALDLSLEAYLHSNEGYDLETDWVYGFEERKPMARLALDFSLDDFMYVYCDLQYGRNRFNYQDELYVVLSRYSEGIGALVGSSDIEALMVSRSTIYSRRFLTNVLEKSYNFDYQWPKRAVASLGGAKWNLSLSRDKLSWGNGHSGNFVVDDHVDYQDFARLVAFSDAFKYDWLTVFFETNTKPGEQPDTRFKILMAHRLEFRILERLSFAISENVMYENDVFDPRYLNPAFIYHNLNNNSMLNAIAHAELDWSFAKGWNLYAQAVMDQAQAPNESAAQSDALGYLGGLEYATAAGPGIFASSLEFALTDPLLYRRQRVDFLMFRKYFTNGYPGPGYILALDYIGYQYGGDALVLRWDGEWRVPGLGGLAVSLTGMRHGEMDFFKSHNKDGNNLGYANYEGKTPSGNEVRETLVASLSGDWALPSILPWIRPKVWARLDWIRGRSYMKSTDSYRDASGDLQATMGCSLSL